MTGRSDPGAAGGRGAKGVSSSIGEDQPLVRARSHLRPRRGFGAGTINAIVGSGTLITFPVLLAIGYPPVVANVSNNLGLVPGAAASAVAYRRELRGRPRLLRYAPATASGALGGAALLLSCPRIRSRRSSRS